MVPIPIAQAPIARQVRGSAPRGQPASITIGTSSSGTPTVSITAAWTANAIRTQAARGATRAGSGRARHIPHTIPEPADQQVNRARRGPVVAGRRALTRSATDSAIRSSSSWGCMRCWQCGRCAA